MNETTAPELLAFLLTYLIHSTLIGLLIGLTWTCWRGAKAIRRVVLWKTALVLPVVSSLIVSFSQVPHWGTLFPLVDSSDTPVTVKDESPDTAGPVVPIEALTNREAPKDISLTGTPAPEPFSKAAFTEQPSKVERHSETNSHFPVRSFLGYLWLLGCSAGCFGLAIQAVRVWVLRRSSSLITSQVNEQLLNSLSGKAKVHFKVQVRESAQIAGPFTAGIVWPFILLPLGFLRRLSPREQSALFAHELVHIARRDCLWKLIGELVRRVFFFQPLVLLIRRRLEIDTEFVTDQKAAALLEERADLARCLTKLCEWQIALDGKKRKPRALVMGMAAFRSILGRRIECLLSDQAESARESRGANVLLMLLVLGTMTLMVFAAPKAIANIQTSSEHKDPSMNQPLSTLALIASLSLPVVAEEEQPTGERPAITKTTPDEFPEGIARFNGMLVGRLVKKDVEKGTFLVNVDAVPRVWRNSQAEDPKSIVGKNVEVNGVFGKWLDVLLLVKEGETLEFEARHDRSKQLTFPGELLRKVAPYKAEDYPVLPEEFRGFQGSIAAKVLKKDPETFEMIVEVERILETSKNSQAKDPKSIEGNKAMLAGFWQRKEAYHGLEVGDRIETGIQHIGLRSDHLTVAETLRKTNGESETKPKRERDDKADTPKAEEAATGFPQGMRGFRGMLTGTLVSKDVEKGEFVVKAERVDRVWPQNKATNTKSCEGRELTVRGVSGKFLDVLIQMQPGDRLQTEAFHNRGDHLDFPGEWLKKVE